MRVREVARRHGDLRSSPAAPSPQSRASASPVGGVGYMAAVRDWPRLDGSALDDALNSFAHETGGAGRCPCHGELSPRSRSADRSRPYPRSCMTRLHPASAPYQVELNAWPPTAKPSLACC